MEKVYDLERFHVEILTPKLDAAEIEAELAKFADKYRASVGARFIITQPIIGRDERVIPLRRFKLPVILDAWMSKKLHLLGECVGTTIPVGTPYDPIQNLRDLHALFPDFGLYLALLGFKTQFPILGSLWT